MEGLLLLQAQISIERRPLSWVVGDQGVEKLRGISMRDLRRPRLAEIDRLDAPDGM